MRLFSGASRREDLDRFFNGLISFVRSPFSSREPESRSEDRMNVAVPVLVAPWLEGRPVVAEATTAITKNFSDRGVALIMHQPLRVESIVLGMLWFGDTPSTLAGEPRFALADVRQNVSLGGGYWQLGVELSQLISKHEYLHLAPLIPSIERLRPDRGAERLPTAASLREEPEPITTD